MSESELSEASAGRKTLQLPSTMESVAEIESIAEKMALEAGFDEDEIFHIAVSVREAAVNSVLHGNENDPAKPITASFELTAASLIFILSDQGKSFDPDSLPDPLAPENLLRGSGRGIFLIRSFMDEVHFRQLNPGTELTMIKHRPKASGTA